MNTFYRKALFIRLTVRVFRERLSICMYSSLPLGFEGGVWDFIVLFPGRCLSIYILLRKGI